MTLEELPFIAYPGGGREQLKRRRGLITRRADGPEFMRITGVKTCAYCGLDFAASFENWLTMALDHVVPRSFCKRAGIKSDLEWSYSNAVLACAACNGFCNRYKPKEIRPESISLSEFYDLRDRIFQERRELIRNKRAQEETYFKTKPWEKTSLI